MMLPTPLPLPPPLPPPLPLRHYRCRRAATAASAAAPSPLLLSLPLPLPRSLPLPLPRSLPLPLPRSLPLPLPRSLSLPLPRSLPLPLPLSRSLPLSLSPRLSLLPSGLRTNVYARVVLFLATPSLCKWVTEERRPLNHLRLPPRTHARGGDTVMRTPVQGRLPIRVELKGLEAKDLRRILVEPKVSLIEQQRALLNADNVKLEFTEGALTRIADLSHEINKTVENIGARRLYTGTGGEDGWGAGCGWPTRRRGGTGRGTCGPMGTSAVERRGQGDRGLAGAVCAAWCGAAGLRC
jgi:hypothetical protein